MDQATLLYYASPLLDIIYGTVSRSSCARFLCSWMIVEADLNGTLGLPIESFGVWPGSRHSE